MKKKRSTAFLTGILSLLIVGLAAVPVLAEEEEHHFVLSETVEATCSKGGYEVWTCSDEGCGISEKRNETPALGHLLSETPDADTYVPVSCEKDGFAAYSCQREGCSYKKVTYSARLGHKFSKTPSRVVEPTCTEDGQLIYTCSRCGQEKVSAGESATGHSLVEAGYCSLTGKELLICENCGYEEEKESEDVSSPATHDPGTSGGESHIYTETSRKAPSCGEDGYIEYTCDFCGQTRRETIKKQTDHVFEDVYEAPTYTKEGKEGRICSLCGKEEVETLAKLEKTSLSEADISLDDVIYTGQAQKPLVTVKVNGKKISDSCYSVSYKNNVNVGTATVTLKAKSGNVPVSGETTKTFKILPGTTSIASLTNTSTGIRITWKQVTEAQGYKIYRNGLLIATISRASATAYTDNAASVNGKTYRYQVAPFASVGDAELSKASSIRFLKTSAITSAVSSASGKLSLSWTKNAKADGYQVKVTIGSEEKTVTVKGASSLSKVIKSLKSGKTCSVSVRAFVKDGSSLSYSAWSVS